MPLPKDRGAYKIEGVGMGYVPPLWKPELAEEIIAVHTADAEAMARWLACEEGLVAGTFSGGNVIAAIRVGQRLGLGARVATRRCSMNVGHGGFFQLDESIIQIGSSVVC